MGGRKVQSIQNKTTKKLRRKLGPSTASTDGTKKLNCHYPSEETYDKCHNADIPCSNGIREIVRGIFPESIEKDASQLPLHDQKSEASIEFKQSIFTLLVRKHLLNKYNSQMNSLQSHQKDVELVNISTKKKRKKKKKKKSGTDAPRDNSNESNAHEIVNIDIPQQDSNNGPIVDEWAWDEDNDDHLDIGSNISSSLLEHSDALKVSTFVSQYMTNGTQISKKIDSSTSKKEHLNAFNEYIGRLMKSDRANSALQDPCTLLPRNRELSSFLSYIEHCYEKNRTNSSDTISPEMRYLPSISTSEISSIIERIQCRHCRNACHNYLESITSNRSSIEVDWGGIKSKPPDEEAHRDEGKIQIGTLILNGSSVQVFHQSSKASSLLNAEYFSEAQELDQAFGYRQLEEGTGMDPVQLKENTEYITSHGGLCLDVVQLGTHGPKYIELDVGMNKSLSPFSAENIDYFIKDVILECGLNHHDELRISDDMMAEIELKANEMDILFNDHLKATMGAYIEFQNHLKDVTSMKSSSNFSVVESRSLRKCFEKQKAFFDNVLDLLMLLDKKTKCAQIYHHPKVKQVQEVMDNLFQIFETCLKRLVQPNLIRIWEMKGNQSDGDKLLLFNDPMKRGYFMTMLTNHALILKDMYEALNVFDDHNLEVSNEASGMSFSVLAATSAFIMIVYQVNEESFPWDQSICNIFKMRNELAFTTNPRTDASILVEDLSRSLSEIKHKINQSIFLLDSSIKDEKLHSKQMSMWNANKIIMEECEMCDQDFKDIGFSLENDVSKIKNILEMTYVLSKQDRYRKELYLRSQDSCLEIKIPSFIYKGIHSGKLLHEKCEGGNGERRVSSILSACLYGWFEKQCIQWHADLTHEELLLDAEKDLLREVNKKIDKKKKQKGSAKKSVANMSTTNDTNRLASVSTLVTVEDSSRGLKSVPKVEEATIKLLDDSEDWIEVGEKTRNADKARKTPVNRNDLSPKAANVDSEEHRDELTVSNEEFTKNEIISTKTEETPEEKVSGNHVNLSDDKAIKSNIKMNDGSDYFFSENVKMGVIDKGKFTSAEDFLCSRYFQALVDLKTSTNHQN